MSRKKKTRSLKGKINIKTGSKNDLIGRGEKGKIPSHNRLAKHSKRQQSAYQKHLAATQGKDTSAGTTKPAPKKPIDADQYDTEADADQLEQAEASFDQLSAEELLKRFEQD
ncbi:MAG: hypothetical protein LAT65_17645 [Saccharospirillum sp.]|nr:hypothetical protein [Saccharospirillum sp.]